MKNVKYSLCIWKQFIGHVCNPGSPITDNDGFLIVSMARTTRWQKQKK